MGSLDGQPAADGVRADRWRFVDQAVGVQLGNCGQRACLGDLDRWRRDCPVGDGRV